MNKPKSTDAQKELIRKLSTDLNRKVDEYELKYLDVFEARDMITEMIKEAKVNNTGRWRNW